MPRGAAGDAGAARSARTAADVASRGGGVLLAVSARVADARDVVRASVVSIAGSNRHSNGKDTRR